MRPKPTMLPAVPRTGRPSRSLEERFWSRVRKTGTCWEWLGKPNNYGYGRISRDGTPDAEVGAHRLAYEWASGEGVPDGFLVCHTCDVRHCVRNDEPGWYEINGITRPRFGHLWLGTEADNAGDMVAKGRSLSGERHLNGKLTESQVIEIRLRFQTGQFSHRDLASIYGVTHRMVGEIVRGRAWRSVGSGLEVQSPAMCRRRVHRLEGENVRTTPNGVRRCRACANQAERERRARQ